MRDSTPLRCSDVCRDTASSIHHIEEDRPHDARDRTMGSSSGMHGVQPHSALRGRPVMLEADANRFAAAVEQRAEPQQLPPPVTTKPPDPQSQLEQHLLDEHELEEEHKARAVPFRKSSEIANPSSAAPAVAP